MNMSNQTSNTLSNRPNIDRTATMNMSNQTSNTLLNRPNIDRTATMNMSNQASNTLSNPSTPSFQTLTSSLLHNIRYYPEVVTRENVDFFISIIRDPARLSLVYDQIALLRYDLTMGNVPDHDVVVYMVVCTKHLLDDPQNAHLAHHARLYVMQASNMHAAQHGLPIKQWGSDQ